MNSTASKQQKPPMFDFTKRMPPRPTTSKARPPKQNVIQVPSEHKSPVKIRRPQSSRNADLQNRQVHRIMTQQIDPEQADQGEDSEEAEEQLLEFSDAEEPCAVDKDSRIGCVTSHKTQLRFRQIQTMERPKRGVNANQQFRFINCENLLIRNVVEDNGFRETTSERQEALLVWSNAGINSSVQSGLQRHQRVNHFPSSCELTRKDNLFKNLQRMQLNYGRLHQDFVPASYILPADSSQLLNDMYKDPQKWWIVKPTNSSQGKGIYLTNKQAEVMNRSQIIVSEQIANPLLVDDFKFDVRLQVIVTSQNPLKIQLQDEGLVRFATEKQVHPSVSSKSHNNTYMHLTNQSINKNSSNFTENKDAEDDANGNKWSFTAFLKFLESNGLDTKTLLEQIEKIIVKSIISAEPHITHACNAHVNQKNNCFETYGQDILIDDALKPWLLEINMSPSMACNSPLDLKIKGALIKDVFNLVGFVANESRDCTSKQEHNSLRTHSFSSMLSSRRLSEQNLRPLRQAKKGGGERKVNSKLFSQILKEEFHLESDLLSREEKWVLREFQEELKRASNMRVIFPNANQWEQKQFFDEEKRVNELVACQFTKGRPKRMNYQGLRKRSGSQSRMEGRGLKKVESLKLVNDQGDDVETKHTSDE